MTTRCLTVTGDGSIGKCGRLSQRSVHYNIVILTYLLTYCHDSPFAAIATSDTGSHLRIRVQSPRASSHRPYLGQLPCPCRWQMTLLTNSGPKRRIFLHCTLLCCSVCHSWGSVRTRGWHKSIVFSLHLWL